MASTSRSEISEEASATVFKLLPEKSKQRYIETLEKFRAWMKEKNVTEINEDTLLVYFNGLLELYAASTLWATYSMLKCTLFVFEKVDIKK